MAATTSLDGCSAQVTGTAHADTIREAMRPLGDLGKLAQVFSMLATPAGCGCWWRC